VAHAQLCFQLARAGEFVYLSVCVCVREREREVIYVKAIKFQIAGVLRV